MIYRVMFWHGVGLVGFSVLLISFFGMVDGATELKFTEEVIPCSVREMHLNVRHIDLTEMDTLMAK